MMEGVKMNVVGHFEMEVHAVDYIVKKQTKCIQLQDQDRALPLCIKSALPQTGMFQRPIEQ